MSLHQNEFSLNDASKPKSNGVESFVVDDFDLIASPRGHRLLGTKRVPYHEFSGYGTNPAQRWTERRAHSKEADHLRVFCEPHRKAVAAIMKVDGRRFKVDAHTRDYMWSKGMTEGVPDNLMLSVDFYEVDDTAALIALYHLHDSKAASHSARDDTHSAANSSDIVYESAMMRANGYGNALKQLYEIARGKQKMRKSDPLFIENATRFFRPQLILFDGCAPIQKDYVAPVFMAALITLARYPDRAQVFWKKYNGNEGIKNGLEVDGVQAARNLREYITKSGQTGSVFFLDHIGRALNAFTAYCKGDIYTKKNGMPELKSSAELQKYIEAAFGSKGSAR